MHLDFFARIEKETAMPYRTWHPCFLHKSIDTQVNIPFNYWQFLYSLEELSFLIRYVLWSKSENILSFKRHQSQINASKSDICWSFPNAKQFRIFLAKIWIDTVLWLKIFYFSNTYKTSWQIWLSPGFDLPDPFEILFDKKRN